MRSKLHGYSGEFPRDFWILIGATFIDRLGGALLFPFFALYVTARFSVGMTEVGVLFAIFSIAGFGGSILGGALTDRFGRRWMIMFGLVVSAGSSVLMGLVDDLNLFYLLAAFVGLLSNAGGPAQQAMVADLLPEDKRAEGFGLVRVVANLAVTVGPAIGGLLAAQSYLLLFIIDAITSLITAVIVYLALPETKPEAVDGQPSQSLWSTLGGYGAVAKDQVFMAFMLMSILGIMVYTQMNSSLSVYLRDVHGVSVQGFGYILSLNAAMVVLFQFYVTRKVSRYRPMLLMAVGMLLYAIGFAMYGFVHRYLFFLVAMVIITIGEMIIAPVGQALAAKFAPEDMRGRYMAVYGFSYAIPFAVAPLLAGLIMDNFNPDWVWYLSGSLGVVSALGFVWLAGKSSERLAIVQREAVGETALP